jgi:hypothetical protein
MVLPSEADELTAAWRALEGAERSSGWRTIHIAIGGSSALLAGRRFPENQEALLVGFAGKGALLPEALPQGRGFEVSKAELGAASAGRVWIALCRNSAGRLDLFTMMARDVVTTLCDLPNADDATRLRLFLARIRAWQDFMRSDTDGCLAPDAEVGLVGELEVLSNLLAVGIVAPTALDAWRGPLDGVQDFAFGTGAIEVKSTSSPSGFLATIGSLEQLDDSLISPIFVAAVRVTLDPLGETLPERIGRIRATLAGDPGSLGTFGNLLLHAGFIDFAAQRYTRRFSRTPATRILDVSDKFPRITRASVPVEIRSARYEVDLDLVKAQDVSLLDALRQLGVIREWN